ncbi:transcriptional regulator [Vibrio europaeus]|uniref:transcriptional regulator n=1 Tax=Vibrio oreintalis group TaxID=1891919 RepID=UPI001EFCABD6|nr:MULTISPECIES: transcriptional regulator [Vibrio oreintalis group]MCG9576383.1 transcriptional regulator [Vibrio tubiashii]MDC5757791.1 transcriptional regulator [Vibrio europaeus]MDC5776287.1 transcriptional regulator [Vibrio europaeus]MDC5795437.1 transcriptional regulator [Vibrio europaeus]MDC5798251.1 transcriptional regulator [Vibrio europaeus]
MEVINYTNALLNRVKAMYDLTSEYQLARKLNVSDVRLYNWRKGRCGMDWDVAFRIADMLGESDQNVVYGLLPSKTKNPRVIKVIEENAPE